jgi:aminoglycoside phosphotransferase (APT) family kinase protein
VTVAARQRDLDAVHDGLTRWVHAQHPRATDVRLGPLRKPSSGYSSETLLFGLTWTEDGVDREDELVARLPPAGGGIFPEYDLTRQANVQRALATTAIPVAEPLAVELDESWVGAPFFVMRRVLGTVLPDTPSYVTAGALHDAVPDTQTRVQRDFVHTLADLHALDWDGLGLGVLIPPDQRGLAHDLDRAETYVQWSTDSDVPTVITDAIAWARAHRPNPEPPLSLIWGDPRLGNVVFGDDWSQHALLDWEMASIAPAELDLAWFVGLHEMSTNGRGGDLPGFVGHDEVLALWSYGLGRPVVDYRWFEVLSLVRAESIFLRIRAMLLATGLDEPWLRGVTPTQRRIAQLIDTQWGEPA